MSPAHGWTRVMRVLWCRCEDLNGFAMRNGEGCDEDARDRIGWRQDRGNGGGEGVVEERWRREKLRGERKKEESERGGVWVWEVL